MTRSTGPSEDWAPDPHQAAELVWRRQREIDAQQVIVECLQTRADDELRELYRLQGSLEELRQLLRERGVELPAEATS